MQRCANEIRELYGDLTAPLWFTLIQLHPLGRVDIVIANAAILHFAHFLQLTTEQIKSSLDVNVMGTMNVSAVRRLL